MSENIKVVDAQQSDKIVIPEPPKSPERPKEIGGPTGPEPTRYGDWEHKGRCSDF
jgi:hypothetical protein